MMENRRAEWAWQGDLCVAGQVSAATVRVAGAAGDRAGEALRQVGGTGRADSGTEEGRCGTGHCAAEAGGKRDEDSDEGDLRGCDTGECGHREEQEPVCTDRLCREAEQGGVRERPAQPLAPASGAAQGVTREVPDCEVK